MSTDPAEAIALYRYRVIAEATNSRLTPSERGRLVRELALAAHEHPDGSARQYARGTLDRWVRAYREQMLAFAGMRDLEVWYAHVDAEVAAPAIADATIRRSVRRTIAKARRTAT